MMLTYLRYRYVKSQMAAYVNGELAPQQRRFVARMIEQDDRCYTEYIRQRETQRELERGLPMFGRADTRQLDALWHDIQAELNTSPTPDPRSQETSGLSLGYGLAVGLCAMALLLPFVFDTHKASALDIPQQPAPAFEATVTVPQHTDEQKVATVSTDTIQTGLIPIQTERVHLQHTPEPNTSTP